MRRDPARPVAPAPPELGGWLPYPVAQVARLNAPPPAPPRFQYVIQQAPDVPLAAATGPACLKDPDCRATESPSLVPVETGTIY